MIQQVQDEGESRIGVNHLEMSTVKRGRINMIPVVSWQVEFQIFGHVPPAAKHQCCLYFIYIYIVNGKLWASHEWLSVLFHFPPYATSGR